MWPLNDNEGCAITGAAPLPRSLSYVTTVAEPAAGSSTCRAIDHMKATSSRAMAVTTTLGYFPCAISLRNRLHSRT